MRISTAVACSPWHSPSTAALPSADRPRAPRRPPPPRPGCRRQVSTRRQETARGHAHPGPSGTELQNLRSGRECLQEISDVSDGIGAAIQSG